MTYFGMVEREGIFVGKWSSKGLSWEGLGLTSHFIMFDLHYL